MKIKNNNIKIKPGSEKNFGIFVSIIFFILAMLPLLKNYNINIYLILVSLFFLIISYTKPKILKYLNIIWFKLGIFLGSIISPIVMIFVYFVIFLPIGIILKILKKDILNKRIDKNINSYWKVKKNNFNMKDQF